MWKGNVQFDLFVKETEEFAERLSLLSLSLNTLIDFFFLNGVVVVLSCSSLAALLFSAKTTQ